LNRFFKTLTTSLLVLASLASFGLVTSCNIIGGGSSDATGRLNLLVTDDPTDDWQEVTLVLKSVSLHNRATNEWADVWTADPNNSAAGTINLVDLSGVASILQSAKIQVGTYNRLKIVIDPDPTTMKLVTDDNVTIDPKNITVVDPSGKGEIKVDLDPDITIEADKNNILQVDFDLAHPLSIVNLDGKVVISLKVRHKPLPRRLQSIQFARTIGTIKDVAADLTTITVTTLQETDVIFDVNSYTTYIDADKNAAGTLEGLKGLIATKGAVLVASNMQADGGLYARRVWYAADMDTLPQFTPEGLVRRVGDNWLSILKKKTEETATGDHHHRCDWNSETVFVDDKTTWTFHTDVAMGTGTSVLRYISRGFRVEVEYVDITVYPHVAKSINVHSAHAEGLVTAATADNFTFGWRDHTRTMVYSGITDHTFGWLFYGMVDSSRSTVIQDFVDAVAQAREARLWIFAHAGLYWDNAHWVVENVVIAPLKLHELTKITTDYTAASGTMGVTTYDCWDWTTPTEMTIALDTAGELQTVVGSFVWNAQTNLVTFTLPVPPTDWETLLTKSVDRVKIWVYPLKKDTTWTWHAYSVLAYQFIR
jgi:Domain of unknown function (DUF4382)